VPRIGTFKIMLEPDYAAAIARTELAPRPLSASISTCSAMASMPRQNARRREATRNSGRSGRCRGIAVLRLKSASATTVLASRRDKGQAVPAVLYHQPDWRRNRPRAPINCDIVTQRHGGNIGVESRVGEFTDFNVRLPRAYRSARQRRPREEARIHL